MSNRHYGSTSTVFRYHWIRSKAKVHNMLLENEKRNVFTGYALFLSRPASLPSFKGLKWTKSLKRQNSSKGKRKSSHYTNKQRSFPRVWVQWMRTRINLMFWRMERSRTAMYNARSKFMYHTFIHYYTILYILYILINNYNKNNKSNGCLKSFFPFIRKQWIRNIFYFTLFYCSIETEWIIRSSMKQCKRRNVARLLFSYKMNKSFKTT